MLTCLFSHDVAYCIFLDIVWPSGSVRDSGARGSLLSTYILWVIIAFLSKTLEAPQSTGPEVIKLCFMLSSVKIKIYPAH